MLTIPFIRDNYSKIELGLLKRGWDSEVIKQKIDRIIELDDKRKSLQTSNDQNLASINSISKEIGELFKSKKIEEANAKKASVKSIKEKVEVSQEEMRSIKSSLNSALLDIPNIPNELVPNGQSEEDNFEVSSWMEPTQKMDSPVPHWDVLKKAPIIDFELGVKITGSGFPVYLGKGAKLERALISFFLDEASEAGYLEVMPPFLVNQSSARATGQLPDKEGQMYHATVDDLYLIPTAEVPITNMYRDEIVDPKKLPVKLTGHTPCFRREAGSYGEDVKGLNRVHQFNKVEIVQIVHPDKSYAVLDQMINHVEGLLKKLELPFRILRLCGGDIGYTSALTYDFEVFAMGQQRWLEVSSVSNFETYQSNRLKLRYKTETGKTALLHTLNGSALALARIMVAILENYQTEDGIIIPEVLRPYTKFDIIEF